jgi:hypothetical protein
VIAVRAFAAGLLSGWVVAGVWLARVLLAELDYMTSDLADLS